MGNKTLHSVTFPGLSDKYIAPEMAPEFSTSTAYAVGDYVTYQGSLYKFTSAHSVGSWNSTEVTLVELAEEVTDLKSALNYGYTPYSAVANGSFSAAGGPNDGAINRIRTIAIPFSSGEIITIENGSLEHGCGMWNGSISLANNTRNDNSWVTRKETIMPTYNGLIVVAFRFPDNSNISPSDFDGSIKIYKKYLKEIGDRVIGLENDQYHTIDLTVGTFNQLSSTRLSTKSYAEMEPGDRLHIDELAIGYDWMVVSVSASSGDQSVTDWLTTSGSYTVEIPGMYRVWLRKHDDSAISPNDINFGCYVDVSRIKKNTDTINRNLWVDSNIFYNDPIKILDSEYEEGWIGNNGAIQSVLSKALPELHTVEYFATTPGDKIRIALKTDEVYLHWINVVMYDADKNYITRATLSETYADETVVEWINTNSDYAFVRFSFRSFLLGNYTFRAVKYSGKTLTKPTVNEYKNQYLITGLSIGSTVNMTNFLAYQNWITMICDCYAGDKFVVSGYGGGEGRLWTFVNGSNQILANAPANYETQAEEIIAPNTARKLIFSASTYSDYALSFGRSDVSKNAIARGLIDTPYIVDPGDAFEKPTVAFHNPNIQKDPTTVNTKFGIFKSGSNMCITYTEDVDHTNQDYPDLSESGKMEYHYRYFHFDDDQESDISYGLVAKKGTSYIDINGQQQAMAGGVSFGSSVNNRLFFSFAYQNTNINRIDYKPCTCSVSLSNSGVSFGEIRELILIVDGVSGEFNTQRFGDWEYGFYTSNPPYYDDNGYKWLLPIANGLAYLTSSDGITWTCENVCKTPYYTFKETSAVVVTNDTMLFAARTNDSNYTRDGIYTFVGLYDVTKNNITQQYRIPSGVAKPLVVKCGSGSDDNLLVITDPTFTHATYYKVLHRSALEFVKWFELYHDATYYANILQDTLTGTSNPTEMYIVGGNGQISNHSSGFIKLSFGTSKPRDIRHIPFMVK